DTPAHAMTIPAEMGAGHLPSDIDGARQFSPFNDYSYMGPCPNMPDTADADIHDDAYTFVVYALPDEVTEVPAVVEGESFTRTMDNCLASIALAASELRGTSAAEASEIAEGTLPPMFDIPCPMDGS